MVEDLLPESQIQNLVLTVLHVLLLNFIEIPLLL
jgi:hypothetical protein